MNQPDQITGEHKRESRIEGFPEKTLVREQQRLSDERLKLEREKKEFHLKQETEEKRLAQESRLFRMKWMILESELQKLALERQELENEKKRNLKAGTSRKYSMTGEGAEVFFSGVDNVLALKKRYKELIKIYHPDNQDGDTVTLQKINKVYDVLRKKYTA